MDEEYTMNIPIRPKYTYENSDGNVFTYPSMGQGNSSVIQDADGNIIDQVAYDKDEYGYTHPNLHRRVDPQDPTTEESSSDTKDMEFPELTIEVPTYERRKNTKVNNYQEIAPRDYEIQIQHVHSYRTTTMNTHDENSITSEIP